KEIASLKKRVKKLERKRKSKNLGMKRLFKIGRTAQVVSSKDECLGNQEDASKHGRKIADIDVDVEVEKVVSTVEVTTESAITTVDELTLAQTLIEIKAAKPNVRGVMIQEPSEFTTTTTTTTPAASKPSHNKGKAKMIESVKPLKKKDQIMYDQEVALNLQAQLQAELKEEERLTRQKEEEANIALIESWDNIQAMMDVDYQMAQQLQVKEQEQLSIEEKSKLASSLKLSRTCLTKLSKEFNTFVDYKTELVEGSEKRAEDIGEEDVAIDVIPLATKPAPIVNFQIHRKGMNGYYEIMRPDGSAKTYLLFSQLLKEFDREDLENL
ncbi:hypothetical protein Tco_0880913, partial [Tanacetum coccineum]